MLQKVHHHDIPYRKVHEIFGCHTSWLSDIVCFEAMGIEKYLSEIKSELMNGKYKPSPVKRVMIPKQDRSERPLGIPTVKDRIVQMDTKIE